MATDVKDTSFQTGVTSTPFPSNAQDFSGSDDEILDNFAEGPDDGIPMGLGGEKGKQSEPASSTLEADIVSGTTKQTGEKLPPADASNEQPAEEPVGEKGKETSPEPAEEPETPEFPSALLQMAGYTDAAAAKAAGFENSESLFAAIKWRSQLLAPGVQPPKPSEQGLYRRPAQEPVRPATPSPETVVVPEETADFKEFQLPADKMDILDEDLQDVLRNMNEHYQQELKSLRASVSQREVNLARQQEENEEVQFDKAVQQLGDDWQDMFGEGSGADLARVGHSDPVAMTNFNHRALLFETVEAVREVNAKQGYKPMSLEQEIHWALMQRYPDKFQQIISGSSSKGSVQRGVTASRPTQRKTPPKSQNAKVLADVNAMLQKRRGYTLDMGQEEEIDGDI
jgi:uncharacterized protein YqeY